MGPTPPYARTRIMPLTWLDGWSGRRDSNPRPSPWQVRAQGFSWTFADYIDVFSQVTDTRDDHGRQRSRDRRAIDRPQKAPWEPPRDASTRAVSTGSCRPAGLVLGPCDPDRRLPRRPISRARFGVAITVRSEVGLGGTSGLGNEQTRGSVRREKVGEHREMPNVSRH